MRSPRATHNRVAVSAYTAETAINTEQTLDVTLLAEVSDIPDIDPRIEDNANEATGKEEPDTLYRLGQTSRLGLNFPRAQPQHFAFLYGFGFGSVANAAAGSGYLHTITPLSNDLDVYRSNPTFTFAGQYGLTIGKRRFASGCVDQITASFAKDSWVKINGVVKGTGKIADTVSKETVNAAGNAVSLTLAANPVAGATAAARLDNVHEIRQELTAGVWTQVPFTAVSAASPAVITIAGTGGVGLVDYEVIYVTTEPAWATFPAEVQQTPLRVAESTIIKGGAWDGSAFAGGRTINSEVDLIEHVFNNQMAVSFVPGAGDDYASKIFRVGRVQALRLDMEFRNWILQQRLADTENFGVYILAEGDIYDTPHKYQVEMIFPLVGVLKAPISVKGSILAQAGDLKIMQHDTYGSAIVRVKDLAAAYAA